MNKIKSLDVVEVKKSINLGNKSSSRKNCFSTAIKDDEFSRLVRMGLGQSSMIMRKDRRGIAI